MSKRCETVQEKGSTRVVGDDPQVFVLFPPVTHSHAYFRHPVFFGVRENNKQKTHKNHTHTHTLNTYTNTLISLTTCVAWIKRAEAVCVCVCVCVVVL